MMQKYKYGACAAEHVHRSRGGSPNFVAPLRQSESYASATETMQICRRSEGEKILMNTELGQFTEGWSVGISVWAV